MWKKADLNYFECNFGARQDDLSIEQNTTPAPLL